MEADSRTKTSLRPAKPKATGESQLADKTSQLFATKSQELVLQKALAAARANQHERYRANTLSALAGKLPPELLPEALAILDVARW